MRWILALSVAFLILRPSLAAEVVLTSGTSAIGFIVQVNSSEVQVRTSEGVTLNVSRSKVREIRPAFDVSRLESLSPAKPEGYFEYAEELAEMKRDPESREAALRIFQLAATLAPEKYLRGGLLGMISVARNATERERFLYALRYHAPEAATNLVLTADQVEATKPIAELLVAVRLLRQGKGIAAKLLLQNPAIGNSFEELEGSERLRELLKACDSGPSPKLLEDLVNVEIRIYDQMENADGRSPVRADATPAPRFEIENLTEFDIKASIFRKGKWAPPNRAD